MKRSFLVSERIRLRAMEPVDLDLLYEMENDPEMWDITNTTVPYSRYILRQYIESSRYDLYADCQLRLVIMRQEDNLTMGTIDVTDFVPFHGRGEVGIALRREFRGCGYATEALQLLCDYAFSFLHLKQLVVHIAADNEVSLHLFRSCGFTDCGLLKQWWRTGQEYKDVLLLQCLRP